MNPIFSPIQLPLAVAAPEETSPSNPPRVAIPVAQQVINSPTFIFNLAPNFPHSFTIGLAPFMTPLPPLPPLPQFQQEIPPLALPPAQVPLRPSDSTSIVISERTVESRQSFQDFLDEVYIEIDNFSFDKAIMLLDEYNTKNIPITQVDTKSELGVTYILNAYINLIQSKTNLVNKVIDVLPILDKPTTRLFETYENLLWLMRCRVSLNHRPNTVQMEKILEIAKTKNELPAPLIHFYYLVIGIVYFKLGEKENAKIYLSKSHNIKTTWDSGKYLLRLN